MLTKQCVLRGAPWGADAKLNLLAYEPWFEVVDADPVNVTCTPAEAQGTEGGEGEGEGQSGVEGEGGEGGEGGEWQWQE